MITTEHDINRGAINHFKLNIKLIFSNSYHDTELEIVVYFEKRFL